jgi:DNA-directed RNA polymerase subunit omega
VVVETPEETGDEYDRMTEEDLLRGLEGLPPAESPGSQRSGY